MAAFFKKFLVLLPVLLLGGLYLYDHNALYARASEKRLLLLAISFLLLYGWIFLQTVQWKQASHLQTGLQASFFVYVFMVLTLTGYFVLFREIAAADWWEQMEKRIDRKDHVNLEPGKIFRIYELQHKQIIGNFLMLFPLAIYLQLLYSRFSHPLVAIFICLLASLLIETLQLATRRSADVDDVLLNTAGGIAGVILFRLVRYLSGWKKETTGKAMA